MKAGQQFTFARWFAKRDNKRQLVEQSKCELPQVQELTRDQLRQVGGGDGGSTQLPNKGW